MNTFIFLCVVLSVSKLNAEDVHLLQASKERASRFTTECIMESGVKAEVLADAKKGNIREDEGFKNFIYCFFKKTGIISSDAKLNNEVLLSKLPQGINKTVALKLVDDCKKKIGKDHADTAFLIFKCYYQGTKQHVLF